MDGRIDVKPEDLRTLARAIQRFQTDHQDTVSRVRAALNNAHWHDAQKDQFEQRLTEVTSGVTRLLDAEAEELAGKLFRLADSGDNILNTRW